MEVGSSNLASPLQFQAFDTLDLSLLALETPVEVVLSRPPKSTPKALQLLLKNPKTECFTGNFTGRIRPTNFSATVPDAAVPASIIPAFDLEFASFCT